MNEEETKEVVGDLETMGLGEVGTKFDKGKPSWRLMPIGPMREVIEVLMVGAKKYGTDNWQRVEDPEERYIDAAQRHLTSWIDGEIRDLETGLSHLAHATASLLFLLWFEQNNGTPMGNWEKMYHEAKTRVRSMELELVKLKRLVKT